MTLNLRALFAPKKTIKTAGPAMQGQSLGLEQGMQGMQNKLNDLADPMKPFKKRLRSGMLMSMGKKPATPGGFNTPSLGG